MPADIRFILDFDSTLVRVETLELMADQMPDAVKVRGRIKAMTDMAMAGQFGYQESLKQRLQLLRLHRSMLPELGARLREEITPSFKRNRAFLAANAERIYVVTSG